MDNLPLMNAHNFDDVVNNNFTSTKTVDTASKLPKKKQSIRKRKSPEGQKAHLDQFKLDLVKYFGEYYNDTLGSSGTVCADDIFGQSDAEAIISYLPNIQTQDDLRSVLGGEFVVGQLDWVMGRITEYKSLAHDDNKTTGQPIGHNKSKRARVPGSQAVNQAPGAPRKRNGMTKKEEAAIKRRRVAQEKAEAKKVLSDIADRRKAQIAAILKEGQPERP
jgi:hypothetical protein